MKNNFLDHNERITEAIRTFRAKPTGETYGAIVEQIRERMQADGHFLIPVWRPEAQDSDDLSFNLHQLQTEDGGVYLVAFTDEEEVHKGQETGIVSNFIDTFFDMVFTTPYVEGFILNPWSETNFTFSKALMQTIVNRMEADNNLLMAGLLHDTVEDTDTTYMEIKNTFGVDVAALVMAHTKNPDLNWEEVRKHKIEAMDEYSFRVKLLIMADMTANLRSLWKDYRQIGDELWERFNAPKEKQAWYYGAMQDKLWDMQKYIETAEVYWEMVGLYKDLFVDFYLDAETDRLYQNCADSTCYMMDMKTVVWEPAELPEGLPVVPRYLAERIEDNWKDWA